MTAGTLRRDTGSAAPRLRIAMVAPPWFELPPQAYGGIESVVADLVNQLVARGHEVTLIGSGRHRTAASRFVQVLPIPPTERLGDPVPEVLTAASAAAAIRQLSLDVVHDHSLAGPLLARGRSVPTVATMHGAVTGMNGEYYRALVDSVGLVAISDAQRRSNDDLHWIGTVHNGIDVRTYPYLEAKDDYVLWLGRFNDVKAPHLAIDAARAAGREILLAGKLNEPDEHAYFDREILPRLGAGVDLVGEADSDVKRRLLAGARSLVFPICWDEPFGLVMIEAMACGTPVVAFRRGSVPEVVRDGVTGVVVDDVDELVGAIGAAEEIDPARCRQHVEERFDVAVMADGYERVYRACVGEGHDAARRRAPRARNRFVARQVGRRVPTVRAGQGDLT